MGILTLEQFFKRLDREPRNDYIVRLRQRYDWQEDWEYFNILLEYNGNNDEYIWSWDYNEGQQHVEVLGYICIDEVDVPLFTESS